MRLKCFTFAFVAVLTYAAPAFAGRWGDLKDDGCIAWGQRQWSSRLADDGGQDWDRACRTTPVRINGRTYSSPMRCDNHGPFGGEWGVWRVSDATCAANWMTPKNDGCSQFGVRTYSARLDHIPDADWVGACARSPLTVGGQHFDRPTRCNDLGIGGMWGEFDVTDLSCAARWDTPRQDQCVLPGLRQWSAILRDVPSGADAGNACYRTPATMGGTHFTQPNVCAYDIGGAMWGEFHVPDTSCGARWDTRKTDYCVGSGRRQVSAILRDIPARQSLSAACAMTVAGATEARAPDRCANEGLGGMWGEWDIADTSCHADERSDDERRYDYYLANEARYDALGEIAWGAGDAYNGHDVRPRGWLAQRMRETLDSPQVRLEGYDTVSFMVGGSGAVIVGGGHMGGYAMTRDAEGAYRCYEAWSNTFSAGAALGASGGLEIGLSSGLVEGFRKEANGVQSAAAYGVGYTSGLFWSWDNPGPVPDIVVFGAGIAGVDASVEYVHVWPDAGPEISCDSVL